MDFDKLSLRVLILSIALMVVVTATVLTGWFFDLNFSSADLWIGGLITFLTFALIYISPLYWKVATVFISIFVISAYVSYLFQWPFSISAVIGLVIVIFILFTYLSI